VCFLGNRTQDEVADLLAITSLVLVPSVHEAFGLVVLEAWAASRPVLFADLAGLADLRAAVATPEVAIAGHDPRRWGDALAAALERPAQLRAWARAGHTLVRERFEWSAVVDRLVHLYRSVLHEHRRAA